MDSNLLKEAIADAKAVRQTALANAKAALEEAFGSRLEAMFQPQLEEDSMESAAPVAPAAAPTAAAAPMEQEAAVNETDIEEIIRELEAELPQAGAVPGAPAPAPAPMAPDAMGVPPAAPLAAPAPAPMAPPMAPPVDAAAGAPAPVAPAPEAPAPEAGKEEDMDEEINISELLESLKEGYEEEEEQQEEQQEESVNEETKLAPSGIGGGKAGGSANKEPTKGASSSSHLETAPALKSASSYPEGGKVTSKGDDASKAKRPNEATHATKDNLSTPGGALKETASVKSGKVGFPDGHKTSSGDDATEGVDRPNEAEHATKDDLSTPGGALKENAALKGQLKEAEETLTYLRGQLNEINLLNAKLLYTNKLFKEFSMNNDKKMKIVEMFDLAKNVREVKMTYAVIAESLNFGADFKKKTSPSKAQTITEGMASKPVAGTAPQRQIIAEGAVSEMKSKFQRLAGIKIQPTTKQ